ncbi:MAG: biotin/lipoyl-binding protein [Deltaproteobacteria bacterium]|nr:MAG: biotin/lipoyl-binding protein [Deltaproteobacteria bacterium]
MKEFDYLINGKNYHVVIKKSEGKKATVEVNGTDYQVEIKTPEKVSVPPPAAAKLEAPAPTPAPAPVAVPAAAGNIIQAPMAGVIMAVKVKPGDTIKTGDIVVTIESMKMENEIRSHRDGEVKEVLVSPGDKVDSGTTLVVLAE